MLKIKDNYIVQNIAGGEYAVYVGTDKNAPSMLQLNGTAAFIFSCLNAGCERDELVSKLLAEYDVTHECAEADVDSFVKKLDEAGVLLK